MAHKRLEDGFSTTISFSGASSVLLWEKEVQPPGIDAGGAIETTTMRNTAWRTFFPKSLKTLTECTVHAAYDPDLYTTILTMLGVNQQITIHFPEATTVQFWGFIDKFIPGQLKEGEFPIAEIKITPTNQDGSLIESPPVVTP